MRVILAYIEQEGDTFYDYFEENGKRRRKSRTTYDVNDPATLWRTSWGLMLQNEDLRDNQSTLSRKFRRRFRVPYSVFLYLVQRCKDADVFGKTKIPVEFRVLIGLRILGRGSCADDIFEMSGIAESTVNTIFHQFTSGLVDHFYDEFVKYPEGPELDLVQRTYEEMGFGGACGSMDATHVRLGKCPHGLRVLATGKEGYPTLAFQCICAPNRQVLYCSEPYLGSYNDITITANDKLCQEFASGLLDEVKYKVVGEDGVPRMDKGGYIIVDGGYQQASWLMPPFGPSCSFDEKRWSEWLESVRKDIECTFGIIKARFRLFMMSIQFHKFADISNAWKAALILHNINITYNGNDLAEWERNLNWSFIDPGSDTIRGGEEVEDNGAVHLIDDDCVENDALPWSRGTRPWLHHDYVDTTVSGRTYSAANSSHFYTKRASLVQHFNYLFKLGLVKWPKRSGVATRLCMRIPKVNMRNYERTRHALYVRKSDFMLRNVAEGIDRRIGEGLFSHYGYKKNDVIAVFHGTLLSRAEYDVEAQENGRGGYCIHIRQDAVLQTYDQRLSGECVASCANSARGCFNLTTGLNAVNNCRLSVNVINNTVKLVCNINNIFPHTELAYDYGADFVYPQPLPLP
jgi:hypothetical protein